ncbi:MAG: RNA polymerase sigma factor [Erysipelotrichaceae bacterium]|jgi:RNA polymerase sigma-70 factor (ECF subfamily)|nr:RNA polymerase sigma factor [Erysipelotrichaceae bacterium]
MNISKLEKAMVALKKGDINALGDIYEMTKRGVFTFILPLLNNYQDAEDIMQSTYVRLYENINLYDETKNSLNWILTIARNLALTFLVRKNREMARDFNEEENINELPPLELHWDVDTPLIRLAHKVLSKEEFYIVMLYAIGEYKHREIAEILNIPLGTVTWKYSEALKKLKKKVNKDEY